MKRLVVIAALGAAMAQQPGWTAEKSRAAKVECYSQSAIEAEQAIRFLTDVMVVSSTCQDTVYAEFRLRNRDAIMAYQKAMIAHFQGAGVRPLEHLDRQPGIIEARRPAKPDCMPASGRPPEAGERPGPAEIPGICRGASGGGRPAISPMRDEEVAG